MPESHDPARENRLAQETSPYLLQHKDNPVDWHPWNAETLAKAKKFDKPILLSVGYAACHWCHVMAHESFEDPQVAALMNEHFINIKVDREERPDLDSIYQQALALLGQHGGWPLTMFLTPDREPFWGGTYFPKQDMYGRPGFARVLEAIAQVYRSEPDKIRKNVTAIQDALQGLARPQAAGEVPAETIDSIADRLGNEIDPANGGLGGPPKFPQPGILKLLWRSWMRRGITNHRDGVELTVRQMSQGGIYDHLGGGYARYAVDAHWLVPHFEKMLYDNAQILDLLVWAWQDTGKPLYRQRAYETVGWLLREMIALDADGNPIGAFAATLDADSEGEEGRFYVWDAAEIDRILGGEDGEFFKRVYDVRPEGNWEGRSILNRLQQPALLDDTSEAKLAECRRRLFQAREHRVRPGWDDKVLADWNGLMIAALAEAAAAFGESDWLAAAQRAFAFVRDSMQVDGRLRHAWRRGRLGHPATLDDYASMAQAALTLFEHTDDSTYLNQAREWVEVVDRHYWDPANGGYFVTADDVDDVIVRTKHAHDNAQPAGNGLMVGVLVRLHYLTGETAFRDRARAQIHAFSGELERNFVPLCTFLNNVAMFNDALQIAIIARREDARTAELLKVVHGMCLPDRVLQVVADADGLPPEHPAAGKHTIDARPTAFVCRGPTCSLPITAPADLAEALRT